MVWVEGVIEQKIEWKVGQRIEQTLWGQSRWRRGLVFSWRVRLAF